MAKDKVKLDGQEDKPFIEDDNRPTLPTNDSVPNLETLSHNWQPGSPAVDMRDVSIANQNPVDLNVQVAALAEAQKDVKEPKISKDEYDRRTKLDVSNPEYINPSLDHADVK